MPVPILASLALKCSQWFK